MERIYKCGICGQSYPNVAERADCETACLIKQKEAEEAAKQQKLEEEKKVRKALIDTTYAELAKMIADYVNDYGSFMLSAPEDGYDWPCSLLGWWL